VLKVHDPQGNGVCTIKKAYLNTVSESEIQKLQSLHFFSDLRALAGFERRNTMLLRAGE
jgi:hypothetical protein